MIPQPAEIIIPVWDPAKMIKGLRRSGDHLQRGFFNDRVVVVFAPDGPLVQRIAREWLLKPEIAIVISFGSFSPQVRTQSQLIDRKSTRLNSSHIPLSRM